MGSTVASQQEGVGFNSQSGIFLCGVCAFSQCLHGICGILFFSLPHPFLSLQPSIHHLFFQATCDIIFIRFYICHIFFSCTQTASVHIYCRGVPTVFNIRVKTHGVYVLFASNLHPVAENFKGIICSSCLFISVDDFCRVIIVSLNTVEKTHIPYFHTEMKNSPITHAGLILGGKWQWCYFKF